MHANRNTQPFLLEQAENWFLGLIRPVQTLSLAEDVAREDRQATGVSVDVLQQAMALPSVQRRYMLSCRLQPELVDAIHRLSVKVSAARVSCSIR